MELEKYLAAEWISALGCTEPASIAYAGATAAGLLGEAPEKIILRVDTRIYKNCYAVGIPYSNHKTGIKWAAAIGVFLKDKSAGLRCFENTTPAVIRQARRLIKNSMIKVEVDKSKQNLFIDFTVVGGKNRARCVIENTHTNIVLITKNNKKYTERPAKEVLFLKTGPGNGRHLSLCAR